MLAPSAIFPVDLVAAPEGEVDAGVARRLDVGELHCVQYSSWPTRGKILALSSSAPLVAASMPEM